MKLDPSGGSADVQDLTNNLLSPVTGAYDRDSDRSCHALNSASLFCGEISNEPRNCPDFFLGDGRVNR